MSTDPDLAASTRRAEPSHIARRLIALVLLCFSEFFLISLRVDAYALASVDTEWAHLLAYAGQFTRFGLGFAAAFLIAAWPRLPRHAEALRATASSHRWHATAVAQLAVFIAFYGLSVYLFAGAGAQSDWGAAVAIAWAITAVLVLLLALLCIAPVMFWREFVRCEQRTLMLAAVVGAMIWLAANSSQALWGPLAEMTFRVAHALLGLIYPSADIVAHLESRTLGTQEFKVNIAPVCSGYEGIGLIVGFLSLYVGVFRKELRFPHALLLFPIGIAVIWLFNAARIAILIAIGTSWSADIALGGFHSQAGWIAFIAVALILIWLANRSDFFAAQPWHAQSKTPPHDSPSAAMLAPLLVLLATTLLSSAVAGGFDWFYPVRVIAVAACLWHYRAALALPRYRPSAVAVLAGIAVFVIWMLMVPADAAYDSAFSAQLAQVPGWLAVAWLTLRVIGSVLAVPIAEELAFRGYLMARLCSREPSMIDRLPKSWFAVVLSSLAFGLLHSAWIAGAMAGLVYAWVRYQRGEVRDAVLAHMTTNALLSGYVLLRGAWAYW